MTVNCAAIPAELIESELFGHEKGSFTGAHERRIGHFEAAHEGTLFLDEIGDMPLPAQAKVLRALETHEITRVGGSAAKPVDLRVVAATNADLAAAVEEKTFRMDLFYRLNVVPLHLPPLRERLEDVPALARHFLQDIGQRTGRSGAVAGRRGPGPARNAGLPRQRAATCATSSTAPASSPPDRPSGARTSRASWPTARPWRPPRPRRRPRRRTRSSPPTFEQFKDRSEGPVLPAQAGGVRREREADRGAAGDAAQPPVQEARPVRPALKARPRTGPRFHGHGVPPASSGRARDYSGIRSFIPIFSAFGSARTSLFAL